VLRRGPDGRHHLGHAAEELFDRRAKLLAEKD
jgi:hypothetical protein